MNIKQLALALALLPSAAWAQTITIGETAVLTGGDCCNAGYILVQNAMLSQSATIRSLSFYVTQAASNLRLGIYDATGPGGGPGHLKAQTNSFRAVVGWNTANVVTQVLLPSGNYWLAYEPQSNQLSFVKGQKTGVSIKYHGQGYGPMPTVFPSNPASDPNHWSFYASLTPSAPVPVISCTPAAPSEQDTLTVGSVVTSCVVTMSDGSQFTGTFGFGSPYSNDGGIFALSGHDLVTATSLPSGNSVQHVTVVATQ